MQPVNGWRRLKQTGAKEVRRQRPFLFLLDLLFSQLVNGLSQAEVSCHRNCPFFKHYVILEHVFSSSKDVMSITPGVSRGKRTPKNV